MLWRNRMREEYARRPESDSGKLLEVKEVKKVMRVGKVMKVKEHVPICLLTKKLVNGVTVWARNTHEGLDASPGIRWEVMQVEKVK